MTLKTRKPTGVQNSPLLLLAGVPGAGKTWAAIEASTLDYVHRCFFIEIGESAADSYAQIPGAEYEIVEHDGTLGSIRQAIADASQEPAPDGKVNLLILDSLTEVWDLIKDNAQAAMNDRVKRKGRRLNGEEPKPDMDLWNRAGDVSDGIIRQLAAFPGPVIATARLDEVTIIGANGKPMSGKDFKIQVHKKTPYRMTAICEARAPRQWVLTKVQTTNPSLQLAEGEAKTLPGFTVAKLFEALGVGAGMANTPFQPGVVDGALNDEPPQPRQQQRQDKPSQEWVNEQLGKFLAMEKAGDSEALRAAVKWCAEHGHGLLVTEGKKIITRMDKAAQALVQQELGAQAAS